MGIVFSDGMRCGFKFLSSEERVESVTWDSKSAPGVVVGSCEFTILVETIIFSEGDRKSLVLFE